MRGKRGDVGRTIVWTVAFIIIVFILAFYLVLSSSTAGTKMFLNIFSDTGKYKIDLVEGVGVGDLKSQEILQSILNTRIDNARIKDLIFEWDVNKNSLVGENIKSKLKEVLENVDDECYLIEFDKVPYRSSDEYIWVGKGFSGTTSEIWSGAIVKENMIEVILENNNRKIKARLYIGEC